MMSTYTDAQARTAVEIHQRTGSASKAAEAVGCGASTIYGFYRRLGMSYSPPHATYQGERIELRRRGYPPPLVEEIVRQYDEGRWGITSLGELHGIAEQTIYGWVKAAGVDRGYHEAQAVRRVRDDGRSPVYLRRRAVEMYLPPDPMPATAIAEALGVCHTTITYHLEQAGVLRDRREKQIARYHGSPEAFAATIRRCADLYHGKGLNLGEIAERMDITRNTVRRWLDSEHNPRRRAGSRAA